MIFEKFQFCLLHSPVKFMHKLAGSLSDSRFVVFIEILKMSLNFGVILHMPGKYKN